MTAEPSQGVRKRGRGLAIFGALVADGSIIALILGGPLLWIGGIVIGCLLAVVGLFTSRRTR
jgi:hypothetical protein